MSESIAMRENLLGLGRSSLTCLPASAAEKGKGQPVAEGAGIVAGNESDAALPIEDGWSVEVCNPPDVMSKGAEGNKVAGESVLPFLLSS